MASMRQYDPPVGDENAKDRPKDDPVVDLFPDDDTQEQNSKCIQSNPFFYLLKYPW